MAYFKAIGLFLVFLFCSCDTPSISDPTNTTVTNNKPPNIIYILADDLGYGDLSCYGQQKFATPNIDRLAKEGMLFTQHYSGSTVCAPSRSALMTGQHTGHTYIRGNKEVRPEGQHPLPDSIQTMAETLQKAGYATGAFGKWGLGYPNSSGDPTKQGFDTFYGYNCQRVGHHYYPHFLRSNLDSIPLEKNKGTATGTYAPILIHEKTLAFIEDHKDQPFFLFVPSIIPHAELAAPEKYMEKYRGKFLPEKQYKGSDDPNHPHFRNGPYQSQTECHASFVAMIDLLDEQVGEIMKKVDDLGLAENTLIIFTSDNGPHQEGGADPDYFDSNGPLKGYKRDLYEGGIRVPMITKWAGKIKAGSVSNHISAFWDVFPTMADVVNISPPKNIDGISFLPELLGNGDKQPQHEYLYWEFHERGGRIAIRKGDWKGVRYEVLKNPNSPLELYNLKNDIGETTNLSTQHPAIVEEMEAILANVRTPSEVFTFRSHGYLQDKK